MQHRIGHLLQVPFQFGVPSSGLEPPRLSAQALNLLRIPFRHEGKHITDYVEDFISNLVTCQSPFNFSFYYKPTSTALFTLA